jgi:hypothetical protein
MPKDSSFWNFSRAVSEGADASIYSSDNIRKFVFGKDILHILMLLFFDMCKN